MDILIILVILLVLIAINGVFAMSEIAIVSSRKVRLAAAAERGQAGAAAALKVAENPGSFLSTIQIGITLIVLSAGAFGEASLASSLAEWLRHFAFIAPYAGPVSTIIVILVITYFSLVLGELVPKRIALNHPEAIASFMAKPMRVLSKVTAPAVHVLTFSTDVLLKLFGSKTSSEEHVTEEDIRGVIERGAASGAIAVKEQELVERVFRVGDQQVSALMVPRTDIDWIDAAATTERIRVAVATTSHSHFPVCRGSVENIVGVVHVKDLVKHGLLTQQIELESLARPPIFVPETMPALTVLEEFKKAELHLAFILDEYGVLIGLVTLNDVVDAVIGEINRKGDESEPMIVQREDGSWLLDGLLSVEELMALMDTPILPKLEDVGYQTVSGLIMANLGRVPRTGDTVTWHDWTFEVVDMDRRRVDKVLLTRSHNTPSTPDTPPPATP